MLVQRSQAFIMLALEAAGLKNRRPASHPVSLRVGIIGGTGLYEWPKAEGLDVETPYGDVELGHATVDDRHVFFVSRHGRRHATPAHRVDYRRTIWALKAARATYVVAVNNSGSLRKEIEPDMFVVPVDLIDRTTRRADTFHDDAVHVHLDPAYCPTTSEILAKRAKADRAVYVAVDGPRFETPAEAAAYARDGDIIGMTGYPEVALAREAGLHYASLAYVANHAPGVGRTVSATTIQKRMADALPTVRRILRDTVKRLPEEPDCGCLRGLASARLS